MSPLTIIITIVIIFFIIMFLYYALSSNNTLTNIQNGQTISQISASSLPTNGTNVSSSNFAYSVWFYVNDWNYRYGEPKVIFGRMGSQSNATNSSIPGVPGLQPCPAVVLGAVENNLSISLSCFPNIDQQPTTNTNTVIHTCNVANIPIQRWVNLIISVYGRTLDVYIDGKLVRTCVLPGIANVNNNADIYVSPGGGFAGWTSKLQYFPNSLNPQEAWNIYSKGYGSWMAMFDTYQVQLSLVQNGNVESTITF